MTYASCSIIKVFTASNKTKHIRRTTEMGEVINNSETKHTQIWHKSTPWWLYFIAHTQFDLLLQRLALSSNFIFHFFRFSCKYRHFNLKILLVFCIHKFFTSSQIITTSEKWLPLAVLFRMSGSHLNCSFFPEKVANRKSPQFWWNAQKQKAHTTATTKNVESKEKICRNASIENFIGQFVLLSSMFAFFFLQLAKEKVHIPRIQSKMFCWSERICTKWPKTRKKKEEWKEIYDSVHSGSLSLTKRTML